MRRLRFLFTAALVLALIGGQSGAFAHCPDISLSEAEPHHGNQAVPQFGSSDHASQSMPGSSHGNESKTDKSAGVCVGAAMAIIAQPRSDAEVHFTLLRMTFESAMPASRSIPPQAEPPRV